MNKKLLAALIVPAMAMSLGMAKAEVSHDDCECKANCDVAAILPNVCFLTCNGGNVATTIDANGDLASALTPSFKLYSNESHKVDLKAEVDTTSGKHNAIYTFGGNHFLILGNTTHKPTLAAVTDCGGASTAAGNDEAIGYQISSVAAAPGGNLTFSGTEYQLANAAPGTTIITLTTAVAPKTTTFNANDRAGAYVANIEVTATAL